MGAKHVLKVPGRYEEIQNICQFVADGAAESGLNQTAIFHVELACDEACTNIIEHAYGGEGRGDIVVSWQFADSEFIIIIRDNGRPFDPNTVPEPKLSGNSPETAEQKAPDYEDVRVGGLGIHFMRQLMDQVQFKFSAESGNTLTLVKRHE